jgi:hypothetical protein
VWLEGGSQATDFQRVSGRQALDLVAGKRTEIARAAHADWTRAASRILDEDGRAGLSGHLLVGFGSRS